MICFTYKKEVKRSDFKIPTQTRTALGSFSSFQPLLGISPSLEDESLMKVTLCLEEMVKGCKKGKEEQNETPFYRMG